MDPHGTTRGGFTLVELMVLIIFLAVVAALLSPALARSSRQDKVEACAANLRTLYKAQEEYYARAGAGAPELGKAYWEKLAKASPPLVQPQALVCPLADLEGAPAIQYLGPSVDPRSMTKDDPIGCDLEANHSDHGHEGGNILMKSGAVLNDNNHNDGPWGAAVRLGQCRP